MNLLKIIYTQSNFKLLNICNLFETLNNLFACDGANNMNVNELALFFIKKKIQKKE